MFHSLSLSLSNNDCEAAKAEAAWRPPFPSFPFCIAVRLIRAEQRKVIQHSSS